MARRGVVSLPTVSAPFPSAGDERRHEDPGVPGWCEAWWFELVDPSERVGVHLRLELRQGSASLWTAVAGPGRRLVTLVDHGLRAPAGRSLELRGPGVWAAPECETPLHHWSLGMEAFAVAVDDPWDALGEPLGERIGLGYDLEWELDEPPLDLSGAGLAAYEIACESHGEVLVGTERLLLEGPGHRGHEWGSDGWRGVPHACLRIGVDGSYSSGTVTTEQGRPIGLEDLRSGPELPVRWSAAPGATLRLSVLAVSPASAPAPGPGAGEAMALVEDAGTGGTGWLHVHQPSLPSVG